MFTSYSSPRKTKWVPGMPGPQGACNERGRRRKAERRKVGNTVVVMVGRLQRFTSCFYVFFWACLITCDKIPPTTGAMIPAATPPANIPRRVLLGRPGNPFLNKCLASKVTCLFFSPRDCLRVGRGCCKRQRIRRVVSFHRSC